MEKLYHYIWQHHLWGGPEGTLSDGRVVEVLDPGIHNRDAGPDFFNAKIKVDGVEWAGNVELHVKASDWHRHGHDSDPAYMGVILHVVGIDDTPICRAGGDVIPQLRIDLNPAYVSSFAALTEGSQSIRCRHRIPDFGSANVRAWMDALAYERLQRKAARIRAITEEADGDTEQGCFATVARSLGFGLNAEPFEMLARNIPLKVLHKHSDNLFQLEALLFGQAGMLDSSINIFDECYQSLCREYYFLMRKYALRPIPQGMWKYARTRPANFPHRRIALLALYCRGGFRMQRLIEDAEGDPEKLEEIFMRRLEGYWQTHVSFGAEPAGRLPAAMNRTSVNSILINAVAPIYFAQALARGNYWMEECAIELLDRIPAEDNSIVRQWGAVGIKAGSAADSQALIELRKEYCDKRKCLHCRFGYRVLMTDAR